MVDVGVLTAKDIAQPSARNTAPEIISRECIAIPAPKKPPIVKIAATV